MSSFLHPQQLTLTYFDLPAKAEPIRLAFHVGGIPFVDQRVNGAQWQTMKAKFGQYAQIPVLEVDGNVIYQSVNILLYAGTLTGLIATDLEGELRMREVILACDDIPNTFQQTFTITNPEERIAARTILFKENGRTFCQLKRIEELVGDREFVVGSTLTIADISVFTYCCMLKCGHFDGFPSDCLDCVPKLKAFVNRIAALPKVQEYYNSQRGPWVQGFKPEEP
jgi:glutathione S-transferase